MNSNDKKHWTHLHWGALVRDIDNTVWRLYHIARPFSTTLKSINGDYIINIIDGFITDSVSVAASDLTKIIKDFENE